MMKGKFGGLVLTIPSEAINWRKPRLIVLDTEARALEYNKQELEPASELQMLLDLEAAFDEHDTPKPTLRDRLHHVTEQVGEAKARKLMKAHRENKQYRSFYE